MAFVKKTWKDRLSEFPGRRQLKRISGDPNGTMIVDVTRAEGTISQEGDAYSGKNMNDLEQRIADEFSEINSNLNGDKSVSFAFAAGCEDSGFVIYRMGNFLFASGRIAFVNKLFTTAGGSILTLNNIKIVKAVEAVATLNRSMLGTAYAHDSVIEFFPAQNINGGLVHFTLIAKVMDI